MRKKTYATTTTKVTKANKPVFDTSEAAREECKALEKLLTETDLRDLGLSKRSYNGLNKHLRYRVKGRKINAFDVAKCTAFELMHVRNIGVKSVNEIMRVMEVKFKVGLRPC